MGNASGTSLPYEITTPLEYEKSEWKLHIGVKKDEKREEVVIFKYTKTPNEDKNN